MSRPRKIHNEGFYYGIALILLTVIILVIGAIARRNNPPATTEATIPPLPENTRSAEDFYEEDGYIRYPGAILGLDVSEHQGDIDWPAVKEAGFEFAIIRAGYRGYDQGGLHLDDKFLANMQGASAAGMKLGVYFYSQATTPMEARAEAAMVLAAIDGFELDYPIIYDWEYIGGDARTANMNPREVTDCAIAFCQVIESEFQQAAVYFNQDLARSYYFLEELQDFDFWLAQYSDAMTYRYDVSMWQYTNSGSVPGIRGKVDIDLFFGNRQ